MTQTLKVIDEKIREGIKIIVGILASTVESFLSTKFIHNPTVGAVVGFTSGTLHAALDLSMKDKVLNEPNGTYIVESVISYNGLFSENMEIYELVYGYTEKNIFYVGLWHIRTSVIGQSITNVLFEGAFQKAP